MLNAVTTAVIIGCWMQWLQLWLLAVECSDYSCDYWVLNAVITSVLLDVEYSDYSCDYWVLNAVITAVIIGCWMQWLQLQLLGVECSDFVVFALLLYLFVLHCLKFNSLRNFSITIFTRHSILSELIFVMQNAFYLSFKWIFQSFEFRTELLNCTKYQMKRATSGSIRVLVMNFSE